MKTGGSFFSALIIFLLLFVSKFCFAQEDPLPVRNEKAILLQSVIMGEDRTLWIHLPANYYTSSNTYPVLYLLDGDAHFKYATGAVDFLSDYDRNRIPDMIVVGIVNVNRGRDFTPVHPLKPSGTSDSSKVLTTAGAGRFLRFLKEEAVPYIDAHYRAQPYRILAGHSLSGLFALYAKETVPELFPATILTSPAINGVNDHMLGEFGLLLGKALPVNQKLFIGIGNEETAKVDSLTRHLKQISPKWLKWDYRKYEDENHFSVPNKTLFDGLKFFYQNWFIDFHGSKSLLYADINEHFKSLSAEFGYMIPPTEQFINNCGYSQLRAGHLENAVSLFAENVRQNPNSFNAYDSLGEAYMKLGNVELAIRNYKKSVEINPDNEDGKEMLKKLEKAINK